MDNKKDLVKRWDAGYSPLRDQILNALKSAKPLESIPGMEMIDGKYDLRGLKFPAPRSIEKIRSFGKTKDPFRISRLALHNVDLSYADMRYTYWQNCKVSNSVFVESDFEGATTAASDFLNVQMIRTNFRNAFIGQNIGNNSGAFINVQFLESDLSDSGFCFPKVEECLFRNCKLTATDFDGCRFVDSKFIGLVDSAFFRGHSIHRHTSLFGLFKRTRIKEITNPMRNVDFSEAKLFGVSFTHGIDLSGCILPSDGSAALIENLELTYRLARQVIAKEWSDNEQKRIALGYIDNILFNKDKRQQPNDIIDLYMLSEGDTMEGFGKKLFTLLKQCSDMPHL